MRTILVTAVVSLMTGSLWAGFIPPLAYYLEAAPQDNDGYHTTNRAK